MTLKIVAFQPVVNPTNTEYDRAKPLRSLLIPENQGRDWVKRFANQVNH